MIDVGEQTQAKVENRRPTREANSNRKEWTRLCSVEQSAKKGRKKRTRLQDPM
jgi:hypothetical protein